MTEEPRPFESDSEKGSADAVPSDVRVPAGAENGNGPAGALDAAVPREDDEIVVVAVTDDGDTGEPLDEAQVAELAAAGRRDLDDTLADLQRELAGMSRTGVPGVDEALSRLGDLDPNDLTGSSEILSQVLAQLEAAMSETPPE